MSVTMSVTTWAIASAVVVFASFIQGSTGVGFALLVAPVLGILAPTPLPVAVLILMLPLNLYIAWRERTHLDFRSGGWITVGRIAGTFGGLWVLVALSLAHLKIFIGVSTIAAAHAARGRRRRSASRPRRRTPCSSSYRRSPRGSPTATPSAPRDRSS